jgi:hypothetical protein
MKIRKIVFRIMWMFPKWTKLREKSKLPREQFRLQLFREHASN